MKLLYYIIYAAIVLVATACSCSSDSTDNRRETLTDNEAGNIRELALEDARNATAAPDDRQFEGALLSIKATADRLRHTGMDAAADLYLETAHNAVDSLRNN